MTTLKKIEKLLGIKIEEQRFGKDYDSNQQNLYSGTEDHIDRLRIDDIEIRDLKALEKLTGELSSLSLYNVTIPNFSDLLAFNPYYLTLEGVKFKSTKCSTKGKFPGRVQFRNMKFDARSLRCFEKSNIGGYRQLEFHNCHIDNIQHLNTIQQISNIVLNYLTYSYKPLKHEARSRIYRISVNNSKLENVSFLPFKKSLSHIEFGSCNIKSLSGLEEFPKLGGISISSDTIVKDKTLLKNKFKRDIYCNVYNVKKKFNLEQIIPLKNYITCLDVDSFKGDSLAHLKKFKRVKHLVIGRGKANIAAFLPIAKQIKSIEVNRSGFYNHEYLNQFKNLTSFKLSNFGGKKKSLQSFKRILPLKSQLQELEIYDVKKIQDAELLCEFKSLKYLKIKHDISVKDAQHILKLKNLRGLLLSVKYKKNTELSLNQLNKLEFLALETDLPFKGFEHLKKLRSLQLGSDFSEPETDINSLPAMNHLKRLNLTCYNQKIKDLSRFSNLKYLRIKGCKNLRLKTMNKLEVLDLDNSGVYDFRKFEVQPNLKKLNLASQFNDKNFKGLERFPNLKVLSVMESYINDISYLEHLKKLEILDLYATSVNDVSVLNKLKKMKKVNLATTSKEDLEAQLDRPEIAVYVGLPTRWLSIWEEDEFGI